MTFKEFLEADGFSLYGDPKVVNTPLKDIKTQVKLCMAPKDGKTSVKRAAANDKKGIKPALPSGLHGSNSQTIKSSFKKK